MRARLRHLNPTPPREARRPGGAALPANDNRPPRWRRKIGTAMIVAAAALAIGWAFGWL